MSRKKMRSKADEFEMDGAGYDEYTNSPAEQHKMCIRDRPKAY